jgi:putative transcriptional regulator
MGVTRKWVNEFESGKGTAQIRLMLDALSALGLSVDVREGRERARD